MATNPAETIHRLSANGATTSNGCWLVSGTQALLSLKRLTYGDLLMGGSGSISALHAEFYVATTADEYSRIIQQIHTEIPLKFPDMKNAGTGQQSAGEYITKFTHAADRLVQDKFDITIKYLDICSVCEKESETLSTTKEFVYPHLHFPENPEEFAKSFRIYKDSFSKNCYNCNSYSNHTRINIVSRVGPIIHISFGDTSSTERYFPTEFSLPAIDPVTLRVVQRKYVLRAAIRHIGSVTATSSSGHYTADVFRAGRWYNANGTIITPLSQPPQKSSTIKNIIYEATN